MILLGPVLEQLNQDLLDPLIDITFDMMLRQDLIPPPPPELEGIQLKVEYVSVMAQAQKAIALGGIERFMAFFERIVAATQDPSVSDKVDIDEVIDVYGDLNGIAPGIVRSDEDAAAIRQARADAAEKQAQMEATAQAAENAKNLAAADTGGDNALTRIISEAGGQGGQISPG